MFPTRAVPVKFTVVLDGTALYGNGGNDELSGGDGDDVHLGGKGEDVCKGGSGSNFYQSCENKN